MSEDHTSAVWLAAIAMLTALISALTQIALAWINKNKLQEVSNSLEANTASTVLIQDRGAEMEKKLDGRLTLLIEAIRAEGEQRTKEAAQRAFAAGKAVGSKDEKGTQAKVEDVAQQAAEAAVEKAADKVAEKVADKVIEKVVDKNEGKP